MCLWKWTREEERRREARMPDFSAPSLIFHRMSADLKIKSNTLFYTLLQEKSVSSCLFSIHFVWIQLVNWSKWTIQMWEFDFGAFKRTSRIIITIPCIVGRRVGLGWVAREIKRRISVRDFGDFSARPVAIMLFWNFAVLDLLLWTMIPRKTGMDKLNPANSIERKI